MIRHNAPTLDVDVDQLLTVEQLVRLWQQCDEPLTPEELRELRHPRTPGIVVIARCVLALVILTVVTGLPALLTLVGEA